MFRGETTPEPDKQSNAPARAPAREPVFVFGSDLAGRLAGETAGLARRWHGAARGTTSGPSGNAFAIACRNSRGALLPLAVIRNYVEPFLEHARQRPELRFHVSRFACEPGGHGNASMARLFERAPSNCRLPGIWRRVLDARQPARLLVVDSGAHLAEPRWLAELERYIALNAPLWDAPAVELVSAGGPRTLVANDKAARALGLKHHVPGASDAYYGSDAGMAAEYLAVWYSTHLLGISDMDQTAQPLQVRIMSAATRAGLAVDQLVAG